MSMIFSILRISTLLFVVFNGDLLPSCSCEDSTDGYVLDPKSGHRYKFHPFGLTWIQALIACQLDGAYLAIINSEYEANLISDLFAKYPFDNVTGTERNVAGIGFYDADNNRSWRTIHGETLQEAGYTLFADSEPNNPKIQVCGGVYRNGTLDDFWCDRAGPYICEKDSPGIVESECDY